MVPLLTVGIVGLQRVGFAEVLVYKHQRDVLAMHAKFNLALPY